MLKMKELKKYSRVFWAGGIRFKMLVFFLVLLFLAIIVIQVPGLIKKQMWRELMAFSFLLLIGMVYSIGQTMRFPMPNPTKALDFAYNLLMTLFK